MVKKWLEKLSLNVVQYNRYTYKIPALIASIISSKNKYKMNAGENSSNS